jgi:hypothetical protein
MLIVVDHNPHALCEHEAIVLDTILSDLWYVAGADMPHELPRFNLLLRVLPPGLVGFTFAPAERDMQCVGAVCGEANLGDLRRLQGLDVEGEELGLATVLFPPKPEVCDSGFGPDLPLDEADLRKLGLALCFDQIE